MQECKGDIEMARKRISPKGKRTKRGTRFFMEGGRQFVWDKEGQTDLAGFQGRIGWVTARKRELKKRGWMVRTRRIGNTGMIGIFKSKRRG